MNYKKITCEIKPDNYKKFENQYIWRLSNLKSIKKFFEEKFKKENEWENYKKENNILDSKIRTTNFNISFGISLKEDSNLKNISIKDVALDESFYYDSENKKVVIEDIFQKINLNATMITNKAEVKCIALPEKLAEKILYMESFKQ